MRNIIQRIAYLQGLADGLGIDKDSKENQILLELIDILDELTETVDERLTDMEIFVDLIEEDLSDVEDIVFDNDDFDDFDDVDDLDFFYDYDDEDFEEDLEDEDIITE